MLAKLLPIWIAYYIAAAAPGPSQVLVIELSTLDSKERGRWGALGITAGTALWVFLVAYGINTIVNSFESGPFVLRWGSALLLAYFIVKNALLVFQTRRNKDGVPKLLRRGSVRQTFIKGFLVNLINPNSMIFFLSLLAPLLLTTQSSFELWVCAIGIVVISFIWYQLLVELASQRRLQRVLKESEPAMRIVFVGVYLYFLVKTLRS